MPEQPDDERYALNNARSEAARMSTEDRLLEVGVYRLNNGTIKARTGNRHLIPGIRLERWIGGERVDITHRLPKNQSV